MLNDIKINDLARHHIFFLSYWFYWRKIVWFSIQCRHISTNNSNEINHLQTN